MEVRAAEALPTRTDPARVRQIPSNLLSNAVKYTLEGGITVEAGVRTESPLNGGSTFSLWLPLAGSN